MPTPSRGAATNRPDTSPKAVARVLRECANKLPFSFGVTRTAEVYALADALEQQPVSESPFRGALTKDDWDARIMRALSVPINHPYRITKAIHAAFPELAPTDDPTETCANCHIAYPVAEVHCTAEGRFLCDGCADD